MTNKLGSSNEGIPLRDNLTPGLRKVADPGRSAWVRCLMQVLWPAFLGAAVTVGVLFSLVDPMQIEWVDVNMRDSREAAYTAAFLVLWVTFAIACSITWFLANTETPGDKALTRRGDS